MEEWNVHIAPSTHATKNSHLAANRTIVRQSCGCQFVASYSVKGYSDEVKRHCSYPL